LTILRIIEEQDLFSAKQEFFWLDFFLFQICQA